jgi:FkbM family methyltransferase
MTVVIDVGAARYGGDYSMERLIDQFNPTYLYAIDPNPALELPELCEETRIELINAAAWIRTGTVGYRADGLNSWLTDDPRAPSVVCIDLALFIRNTYGRHEDDNLVLKLDCEGSEYELLDWVIANDADELLDVVIVEWHPKSEAAHDALSADIIERIRCEIREWPY